MQGRYGLCAACGDYLGESDRCRCLGAGERVRVVRDHVVAVPAGILPCARCQTTVAPVALRGWTRVYAFVLGARECRRAGYACTACARSEAARSLLLTACLGWWSLQSLLLLAPRATLRNWRAAYTHPADPGRWGAISAAEFRHRLVAADVAPQLDEQIWDSPLLFLDRSQAQLVCAATGLYERLGVAPGAEIAELRAAYRARRTALHAEIRAGDESPAQIAQLNGAWEILRDARLRAAYDWLQAQRAPDLDSLAA
jgi:hypothetical protein